MIQKACNALDIRLRNSVYPILKLLLVPSLIEFDRMQTGECPQISHLKEDLKS